MSPREPHSLRGDPGDVREPDDDDASDWDEPVDVGRSVTQKDGPGLEALKLAVHRPEEVADRLHAVLFSTRCSVTRSTRWCNTTISTMPSRRHRPKWPASCAG